MLITLLVVTFVVSAITATIVVLVFNGPIDRILKRLIPEEMSKAWGRYLKFVIYVVGISSGVRVFDFERYLTSPGPGQPVIELTGERWVLEIYQTIISTLSSAAMVLFFFFLVALIAFVIVRAFELRKPPQSSDVGH